MYPDRIRQLEEQISALQEELAVLKLKNRKYDIEKNQYCGNLSNSEIIRYSRQMLLPEIHVDGQNSLKNCRILLVGIGGLGCPVALYLAAAGVGELTLVDNDEVELSNLHRQVLHCEGTIGLPKAVSGFKKLTSLNSGIKVIPLQMHISTDTISDLFANTKYDVVVDGTDNVATRYLLNDICVIHKIPLVSGSALQMEGQLTVYNYKGGPCYRCLFPKPPPPESVTSCGDGGVLGPVPGVIGVLQALETIKIVTNQNGVLSRRMLIFDACDATFRNVKLRNRNSNCDVCGDYPTLTKLIDYEQFCGSRAHDKVENIAILSEDEHISCRELFTQEEFLLIDVRPSIEYKICNIAKSYNVPLSAIEREEDLDKLVEIISNHNTAYLICRRGNDSQRAAVLLKQKFLDTKFINVNGGLHSYSKSIDNSFPIY